MTKRVIAVFVLAALLLALIAACGNDNGFISAEQAQKIALEDLGMKASQVDDAHTHAGALENGTPIYNIHITVGSAEYEYVIQASDGQILSSNVG